MKTSVFEPYETIRLEKLSYGLNMRVGREMNEADTAHYITYMVRGYVWSQDAGKKVFFKYPADWWEAFKERWFKGWLLEKFPVNYIHRDFEVKATYPHLTVQSHDPILRLIESRWEDRDYWRNVL